MTVQNPPLPNPNPKDEPKFGSTIDWEKSIKSITTDLTDISSWSKLTSEIIESIKKISSAELEIKKGEEKDKKKEEKDKKKEDDGKPRNFLQDLKKSFFSGLTNWREDLAKSIDFDFSEFGIKEMGKLSDYVKPLSNIQDFIKRGPKSEEDKIKEQIKEQKKNNKLLEEQIENQKVMNDQV